MEDLRDIDQRHAAKSRALREDRIDAVEDQASQHEAAGRHVVQHPRGSHPALRGIEDEDAVDIALSGKLVTRSRKHPLAAIEVVARAEIVGRDERRPRHRGSNTLVALQQDRHRLDYLTRSLGISVRPTRNTGVSSARLTSYAQRASA